MSPDSAGADSGAAGGASDRWARDSVRNPLTYVRVSRDAARDVVAWRKGQPSSARTYLALRTLHRRTAGLSSRAVIAGLRLVPGDPDNASVPQTRLEPSWRPALETLRSDGVAMLPPVIDADAVARIRDFATDAPASVRCADGSVVIGTYAQRPEGARSVHLREAFVLNHPDIQRLIAHPGIQELARRYVRAGVVVHPPSLYWSCGGSTTGDADLQMLLARRFHWDYDGVRGLRVHLYLTDVDAMSAPMHYVAGSHRPGAYRSAALRAADRGVDTAEVWRTFDPAAERTMTGPAGTAFVSDSAGLHSGTDPISRDRLFLVMPIQATGFAGYQLRARTVDPRDPVFSDAVSAGRPEVRLFRPRTERPER